MTAEVASELHTNFKEQMRLAGLDLDLETVHKPLLLFLQ